MSTTSWTPISFSFTTGASPLDAGRIYAYKNTGSGYASVDDLGIAAVPSTPNLASNGTFETGSLANWCNTGAYCVGHTVSSTVHYSGSYAGAVTGANSDLEQVISGLTPNTTYTLTANVRSTSGEQTWFGIKAFGGTDSRQIVDSDVWTPVAITFTTGPSATTARIFHWKQTGSGSGYVDNVSVNMWSLQGH